MRYSYTHSEYMVKNESGTVEEMVANHERAEYLHHLDIMRIKMDVAQAAGALQPAFEMHCIIAMDDRSVFKMRFFIKQLDLIIDGVA